MAAARLAPLLFLLALAACAGAAEPTQSPTAVEPLAVRVAPAMRAAGSTSITATGTVRARRETVLAFTTAGRLTALPVDEGDRVRPGQLLASLDRTQVSAGAAAAQARAQRASADLARLRTLFGQGWVTRTQLDAAQAAVGTSQAEVRAASFDVDAARVSAPSSGVVLRRHVEPGQIVAAGAPVVTLAEGDDGFVLRVPLADRDLDRLTVGQPAIVRIASLPESPLSGSIIEIGARSDGATGTFEAEIALPFAPGLRSGLIGDVELTVAGGTSAASATVPSLAVFAARAGEGFVYTVHEGRARARLVRLGRTEGAGVEVIEGLSPGEQVIVTGIERLRDGMPVRVAGQ